MIVFLRLRLLFANQLILFFPAFDRLFVKRRRAAVALVQRLLVGLAALVLRLFVAPLRLANALGQRPAKASIFLSISSLKAPLAKLRARFRSRSFSRASLLWLAFSCQYSNTDE